MWFRVGTQDVQCLARGRAAFKIQCGGFCTECDGGGSRKTAALTDCSREKRGGDDKSEGSPVISLPDPAESSFSVCVCACQLMLYYAFVRISLHGRLCASKTCYLLVSAGWFLDWMTGDWPDDKKSDQLSDCFTRSTTDWQLDCLVFSLVWRLMYCLY